MEGSLIYLIWNLDQDINLYSLSDSDDYLTLTHSGSATISHSGNNSYSNLRIFVHDSQRYNEVDVAIFTAGMSGSYQQALSRYSSWSGDFNIGVTRTRTDESETETAVSSINLNYANGRLFGWRNLRFDSVLSLKSDQFVPYVSNPDEENRQISWRSSMFYQVGLLSIDMSANFTTTNKGDTTQNYLLKVTRSF
jgi:hypothetical protein